MTNKIVRVLVAAGSAYVEPASHSESLSESDICVTVLMRCILRRRKLAPSIVSDDVSAEAPLRTRQATSSAVLVISPSSRRWPSSVRLSFCLAFSIADRLTPLALPTVDLLRLGFFTVGARGVCFLGTGTGWVGGGGMGGSGAVGGAGGGGGGAGGGRRSLAALFKAWIVCDACGTSGGGSFAADLLVSPFFALPPPPPPPLPLVLLVPVAPALALSSFDVFLVYTLFVRPAVVLTLEGRWVTVDAGIGFFRASGCIRDGFR